MALTKSTMLDIGTTAPAFSLPDTISGQALSLNELKSDTATVVMFICNHCPYVVHLQSALINTANEYQAKGIRFVAISANDAENYPADSPEKMKLLAEELKFDFPYLYDETQDTAKAYKAACTPDFFVFDNDLKCTYRGRYDGSTPGNGIDITGEDLTAALDAMLDNKPVSPEQKPSMGCNIKWK
jgi:peroxiredoxin